MASPAAHRLSPRSRLKPVQAALVAGLAVLVGVVVIYAIFAAGTPIAFEAESGTVAGAAITSVAGQSGSGAVKFAAGTPTPVAGVCANPGRVSITAANKALYPAYPVGAKVYVPDGSDPWGGCFPGPSNTGVPPGTQLTAYTGSCTITTANTVIDKKTVNCDRLDVRAQGIAITNSQINGRVYIDTDWCSTSSFTITDSSVHTNDNLSRALMYCNYTATRVNLSGGGSMAICQNCTIQDSYLHDPLEDPTGHAHNSTVRIYDHANIVHNTLWCNVKSYNATDGSGESSGCSADQTGYSHDGNPPFNSTLRRNFYAGTSGGYCAWGGSTGPPGDQLVHDIKFIENIFQRGSIPNDWKPSPAYICGSYGPLANLDYSRPGNEFTNNTWDNGKPLLDDMSTWADVCGTKPECWW